jgi:hypothetical protein
MTSDFESKNESWKKEVLPPIGASNFRLTSNNLKSETLKQVCIALQRSKKAKIRYFLTLDSESKWSYHQFRIEVFDNPHPLPFPLYFDPPLCVTIHETSIFDDFHKERLDIAIGSSIEIRVLGQVRNGSNRIQFTQGKAVVDEIKTVKVFELDDEQTLHIDTRIDPYTKDTKK